ncbi:MAG: sugar-binding protein [FCB group bacterium]|nr:sugar-binding protein [FCB group bacterium]
MRTLAAGLLLVMALASCAPAPENAPTGTPEAGGGKTRVALVTNSASDFWTFAHAGALEAAKEFNCDVEYKIPAQGTVQEQQQIVEDLISTGVSGIAISPLDPKNQTEMLNAAAAKVNLVTQDSDAPDSNRACYVGTDNHAAGVEAGKLIKQALPKGGKIMLFVGTLDAQNARDRKQGIEDELKGSGIEVVDTRTDETDRVKAVANVQDAISSYPDLAGLVGLWSYNGPAILTGVRDSGKLGQVQIICFDEESATLQGVKEGQIAGTIVQQPYKFGYESVKLLSQLQKGDTSGVPESKQVFVPVRTITKDNVADFEAELSKLRQAS